MSPVKFHPAFRVRGLRARSSFQIFSAAYGFRSDGVLAREAGDVLLRNIPVESGPPRLGPAARIG
ncbi:hypothetical protein BH10BDE1_BH10BDE1_29360 [soil metagenome]